MHLIWWTDQTDVERIEFLGEAKMLDHWPTYLLDQFSSRNGRPGRGRLWCAEELEKDNPPPPDEAGFASDNPVCRMAADSGGIVIRESELKEVQRLPGFVTTFEMTIYPPLAPQ